MSDTRDSTTVHRGPDDAAGAAAWSPPEQAACEEAWKLLRWYCRWSWRRYLVVSCLFSLACIGVAFLWASLEHHRWPPIGTAVLLDMLAYLTLVSLWITGLVAASCRLLARRYRNRLRRTGDLENLRRFEDAMRPSAAPAGLCGPVRKALCLLPRFWRLVRRQLSFRRERARKAAQVRSGSGASNDTERESHARE